MSNLDLDGFLVALSEDAPCGDDLEYDPDFTALETAAEGKPKQQMGDSIIEAEPPNWSVVKKDALALLGRTRDLRVTLILSQALLNLEGLAGLHDGLRLFGGLLDQLWESVHPQLDPDDANDPTERINILNGLCDFEKILWPMHRVPLVEVKGLGGFGLRDIQIASGRIPAPEEAEIPNLSEIETVFRECDPEHLRSLLDTVQACQDEVDKIEQAFSSRLGPQDSPDLSELRSVLKEINIVVSQHTDSGIGEEAGFEDEEFAAGADASGGGAGPARVGAIQGPQDVIRVLDQICDYYRKNEPSSPIPILLNRAKNLVSKDFMEIMKDLAPDGVAQVEMFRGTEEDEEGY